MKNCIYRGEFSVDRYSCGNHQDLIHDGTVAKAICESCPYSRDAHGDFFAETARLSARTRSNAKKKSCQPCAEERKVREQGLSHNGQIAKILPAGVTNWAVGVSVGVRRVPVIQHCLESIAKNGWSPVVFAEPGVEPVPGFEWIQRPQTIAPLIWSPDRISPDGQFGIFQNYLQTLADLLVRFPDAEAILYVQDDVIFSNGVREFMERDLWPSQKTGFVSPYCPNEKGYRTDPPQCRHVKHMYLISGQTYCFPREIAERIVADKTAALWKGAVTRHEKTPWKKKALDAWTGIWMANNSLKVYFYSPSLCNHHEPQGMRGRNTTTGNGPHVGFRRAFNWIGQDAKASDHISNAWVRYNLPDKEQRFPDQPEVSPDPIHVIIPGVDSPQMTISCLDHLSRSSESIHACYVDNGSRQDSLDQIIEFLSDRFPGNHEIVRHESNLGFTAAINAGLLRSAGRHSLLLNNDCRISSDCLSKLRLHLEWHPKVASVCPLTNDRGRCSLRHRNNQIESGVSDFSGEPDEVQSRLNRTRVHPQDVLPWFCCLLHRDAISELNALPSDKEFSSGLAVDDWWSIKMRKQGWMHLLAYDAFAAHDHMTTFANLGLNRGSLLKQAQAKLRRSI